MVRSGLLVLSALIAVTAAAATEKFWVLTIRLNDVPKEYDIYANGTKWERKENGWDEFKSGKLNTDRMGVMVTLVKTSRTAEDDSVTEWRYLALVAGPDQPVLKKSFSDFASKIVSGRHPRAEREAFLDLQPLDPNARVAVGTIGDEKQQKRLSMVLKDDGSKRYILSGLDEIKTGFVWVMARNPNAQINESYIGFFPLCAGDWQVVSQDNLVALKDEWSRLPFPTLQNEKTLENVVYQPLTAEIPAPPPPPKTVPVASKQVSTTDGYLQIKVTRDTKVTINGNFTEQEGEIRLFRIPLKPGETFKAKVKIDFRHPTSGRQIIREKTYTIRAGESVVENDVEAIAEVVQ